ncbi:hypothetical protein CWE09_00090 [Aliidiomarina minuta]|uniref:Bacterial virulence factor lipase N-terminal domain-containing protein n=1 Tax=Aliidiomarina minuta TaxID=880057 RepID=A0A432W540_9GAMM|nr:VolA/Pla-1 family phospholipase [Aliidiomarina minuta]RUO25183.1 hypothetical protein CWE09_00090 [Aliidiomarina minuta]
MKKIMISAAVTAALGLTGCLADGSSAPVTQEEASTPYARVTFDPGAGAVSVPNNLLYLGTNDGTLDIASGDEAEPTVALSALDGWSTSFPIVLGVDLPGARDTHAALTLDAASIERAGSVRLFKVYAGGELQVEGCANAQPVVACAVQEELTYGEDFVVQAQASGISVVPLRPLEAKTSYMVAVTDMAEDGLGRSLRPSQTYFAASSDAELTGDGAQIQGIIQQNHSVLDSNGVSPANVVYSAVFTTQSTADVLQVVQSYLAADLQRMGAGAETITSGIEALFTGNTVANALTANVDGFPSSQPDAGEPFFAEYAVSDTADLYAGSVDLPYFSGIPSEENPMAPLSQRWEAEFVSPVTVALALQSGDISGGELVACNMPQELVADFDDNRNPAVFSGQLAYAELPEDEACSVLDDGRHLTKHNPLPLVRDSLTTPLWMSVPDEGRVNDVRQLLSSVMEGIDLPSLQQPADGWPVVIFQHGITGNKEQFLAIAGALSLSGHAVIAIDHPLHGERGFGAMNASASYTDSAGDPAEGDPTVYLNLGNLLTARDNLRQSTADLLSLRFALGRIDSTYDGANINPANVKFIGHSLGGIAGVNMVGIANTPFPQMPEGFPLSDVFGVNQAVFGMAGGGIAPFLIESEQFGPIIREQLAEASGVTGADLDAVIQEFMFAAQTVVDSGDPINYGGQVQATETPVLLIQANGDTVIPNQASLPLAGTEPLAGVLGLQTVTEPTMGEEPVSGFVRFNGASHASLLQQAEGDAEMTTLSIQLMIGTWLESQGTILNVDAERAGD